MYAVILAGGGGTRLWPLSRPEDPKPFLPLLSEQSLLQQTVERLSGLVELADITVVVERRLAPLVRRQVAQQVGVLEEPVGRNTAAAVALATLAIERPEDEVMLVLPADHTIMQDGVYRGILQDAHDELALGALGVADPLVTLGVQVDRPATEYGYLIPDLERRQARRLTAYALRSFEEKPTAARAQELRREPGVAWNAGMFMWRRGVIRAALERYTGLLSMLEATLHSTAMLDGAYDRVQPISIDYAVMEGAARDGKVLMGAMDVGWSDLGTWTALLNALGPEYSGAARVTAPAEPVELGEGDLLLRREGGQLVLLSGPAGTISADGPMALLPGASGHARVLADLIARVTLMEETL